MFTPSAEDIEKLRKGGYLKRMTAGKNNLLKLELAAHKANAELKEAQIRSKHSAKPSTPAKSKGASPQVKTTKGVK